MEMNEFCLKVVELATNGLENSLHTIWIENCEQACDLSHNIK